MSKPYEVNLTFTASLQVQAADEDEAIELAMEKAHANYGLEVYEFGSFTIATPQADLFMDLASHAGHEIECVTYAGANAAVECVTCSTVLIDYDKEIQ